MHPLSQTGPFSALTRSNATDQTPVTSQSQASHSPISPQYFTLDEISSLLERRVFVSPADESIPQDIWKSINSFRSFVSSALNQGLSEIIASKARGDSPIVEIGSGVGYTLSEGLSSKTIRTQTSPSECQLLKRSLSQPAPVYQLNIEELHHCLKESGKKIPLFFALNVFDTMSPDERKSNLSRISQLQNQGDRILILQDTNPYLESIVKALETRYPKHAALPYFPLKNNCHKLSFIMVPVEFIGGNPAAIDIANMMEVESRLAMQGFMSQMRMGLNQLQSKLNLKVVALEDFFVEQLKSELAEIGYTPDVRYHASFTTGTPPSSASAVNQDLIYKSITDTGATVRQWSLSDNNFVDRLNQKGLALPSHFDKAFLEDLKRKKQIILGAEILVIEATKN